MNTKQLGIILAILVLCIGGVFLAKSRTAKTVRQPANVLGQKVFPELGEGAINEVVSIDIRDKDGAATLSKKDGTWKVEQRGSYPADFAKVSDFLRSVWGLKIAEAQVVGESKLGVLELKEPGSEATDGTGTLVELKNEAGEAITRFVLGKTFEGGATQTGPMGMSFGATQGRFIKTKDSGDNVWMISESFTTAAPKPADWIDKEFVKVQKILEIDYTDPDPAESWRLKREDMNADMVLADAAEGEELDTSKAAPLKNALTSPSFKDIVVDPDNATTGLDNPRRFVLRTDEGFTYDVKVGNANDDGDYYMTVDVEGTFPTTYVPEEEAGQEEPADAADAGQSEEEKKKAEEEERKRKEEEFQKELERKQEKLAKEEALEGTVFVVNKWSLDSMLKKRSELLKQPEAEDGAGPATGTPDNAAPSLVPTPAGDSASTTGEGGSRPRVTAVTPPISVPIPPKEEDGDEASAEEPGSDAPEGDAAGDGAGEGADEEAEEPSSAQDPAPASSE